MPQVQGGVSRVESSGLARSVLSLRDQLGGWWAYRLTLWLGRHRGYVRAVVFLVSMVDKYGPNHPYVLRTLDAMLELGAEQVPN